MSDDDLITSIARFRVAWQRENLDPPEVIILGSHDAGMRFLSYLSGKTQWIYDLSRHAKPVEHPDGYCYMEAEVYGMKIRWPAVKYAKREGGYVWY